MKKLSILIVIFFYGVSFFAQQDPQYNLYQFNQMIINPAYAGARDGVSIIGAVRQQWAGIDGAPRTICLSGHTPILNKKLGVGVTLFNDRLGPRDLTAIYGNIAYILKLSQKYKLSFGLNAGYNSYRFNFQELTFKTPETNSSTLQNQKAGELDLSGGTYLRSNKFFFGFSFSHVASSNVYQITTATGQLAYHPKTHLFLTAGRSFQLNENCIFAPTIMLRRVTEADIGNMDLNLNFFLLKKLWLGFFVRSDYGPGFLIQYYVSNRFRVGYSYDSGAGIRRSLGSSHEIMLGFDIPEVKSKVISPRFL
ncbi:MAG: type IX secretion system membrane protein PorP/SprF [Sphingobacteriaceae bacterium]|nr:type IX secretion system membrane protein PorP/SprF [Sphingobacteriaceae bacterium]